MRVVHSFIDLVKWSLIHSWRRTKEAVVGDPNRDIRLELERRLEDWAHTFAVGHGVCPLCNGMLIDHGDWVSCDTCDWNNAWQ